MQYSFSKATERLFARLGRRLLQPQRLPHGRSGRWISRAATVVLATCCGLLLLCITAPNGLAQRQPRSIAALYRSDRGVTPASTSLHHLAELPLNHLGYVVRYHDLAKPLPAFNPSEYAGIVAMFDPRELPLSSPEAYAASLQSALNQHLRVVILGETGFMGALPLAATNQILERLGASFRGSFEQYSYDYSVVYYDPTLYFFELRTLPIGSFPITVPAPNTAPRSLLTVQSGIGDNVALATIGRLGGYIAPQGLILKPSSDQAGERVPQWIVNPFEFLSQALAQPLQPVPDTTTRAGSRILLMQVALDSLPISHQSLSRRHESRHNQDARSLYRTIPHSLPVSVTINCDTVRHSQGRRSGFRWFLRDFVYPYAVELLIDSASDRSSTRLSPARPGCAHHLEQLVAYCKKSPTCRARMRQASLSPLVSARLDATIPSLASIPPLSLPEPTATKHYAPMPDVRALSRTMPPGRNPFLALRDLLNYAETPLRVKPASIAFSSSDLQREAPRTGLSLLLADIERQPYARLFPSEYRAIVEGFHSITSNHINEMQWEIRNRGALNTVRFDHASRLCLDLERSQGAFGALPYQGSLYIHLDPKHPSPIVSLAPTSDHRCAVKPSLVRSTYDVHAVDTDGPSIHAIASGIGPLDQVWRMPQEGCFDIFLTSNNYTTRHSCVPTTSSDHLLAVHLDNRSSEPRRYEISVALPREGTS